MKNLVKNVIMSLAIIMAGLTIFTSCGKKISDEFVGTIKISDTETNVIARYEIPEDTKVDSIVIKGTLYEYDEKEQIKVSVIPFKISNTEIHGNFRNIEISTNKLAKGGPVPGAEIIIEQEPNEDPVAMVTTDADNGSFIIKIKNPTHGFYTMKTPSMSTKGGFAVGGFNAT